MTEIALPNEDDIRFVRTPTIEFPIQVNRSAWTNTRKVLGLPGVERWIASLQIGPITTETNERPWRAFLFGLRGPENFFNMPLPCATHAGPKPTVDSGASNGYELPLTGLTALTTILQAGQFMTVPLPSGHNRAVCLIADLVSDGSGKATAAFEPALGETPTLGVTVETKDPFIPFSSAQNDLGFVFDENESSFADFSVEESI